MSIGSVSPQNSSVNSQPAGQQASNPQAGSHPLKVLSVELQDSQHRTLAHGHLSIPLGASHSVIQQMIGRIHNYSGSNHINGFRASLALVDRPPAEQKENGETPPPLSDFDCKQKDEIIELAKQESKDKDAVIEDLRAQIKKLSGSKVSSGKSKVKPTTTTTVTKGKKPAAKNSKPAKSSKKKLTK